MPTHDIDIFYIFSDIDVAILFVCPPVCHIPALYQNGLTHHHAFFSIC